MNDKLPDPVKCKSCGLLNDPYPETGRCIGCSRWLKGNKSRFNSETRRSWGRDAKSATLSQKEIAHKILKDEGIGWNSATEGLRQLAIQFAKTGHIKTYELILQQLDRLKARPKSSEDVVEAEIVVYLTSDTVENLEKSLEVLDEITQHDQG